MYLFFYCHINSRNYNIPTWSKCEINSSVTNHSVASVPGFLISLVLLPCNTPHRSSNSWSHDTLLWWSYISYALFV